jgi:hypothetical protein
MGMYFHNEDSIFIQDQNSVYIIDKKANVCSKYILHKLFRGQSGFSPITNNYFRLHYFGDTKQIFLQNLYPTEVVGDHLESPVISVLDLSNWHATLLPISFSRYFKKINGRTGFLRWMNFVSYKNDSLFFSSQFDDELIIYDKKRGEINKVSLKNKHRKEATSLSLNASEKEWVQHAVKNPHRFALLYDKWKNIYYRFIWEGVPVKQSGQFFNTMMDKPLSLEIFNSEFRLLTTLKFPEFQYRPNTWFVTEKGLYISTAHPKSSEILEDKLKFEILNFVPE